MGRGTSGRLGLTVRETVSLGDVFDSEAVTVQEEAFATGKFINFLLN